jgi:hypothetical protein
MEAVVPRYRTALSTSHHRQDLLNKLSPNVDLFIKKQSQCTPFTAIGSIKSKFQSSRHVLMKPRVNMVFLS